MNAKIFWIEAEDLEMATTIKLAQDSFVEFARMADLEHFRLIPVYDDIAIKAFFPNPGEPSVGEHIFLSDVSTDGKIVSGTLNASPNFESELKEGETVSFPITNISDWFLVMKGKGIGGYTVDVMWNRFSQANRDLFRDSLPFAWYIDRLDSNRTAQMELLAVPECTECGQREFHASSYRGTICGICANGGRRLQCQQCAAPIIRFANQLPQCHRCSQNAQQIADHAKIE